MERESEPEDQLGKTVGFRRPASNALRILPADTKKRMREWAGALGRYPVKKGVYRFSSYKEADLWMTKLAAKRGAMNIRETQASKTL